MQKHNRIIIYSVFDSQLCWFGKEVKADADSVTVTHSLVSARVLPANSEQLNILSVTKDSIATEPEVLVLLQRAILRGFVDVTVCYSSVSDECWTSSLQELFGQLRGVETSTGSREVRSCESAQRSRI